MSIIPYFMICDKLATQYHEKYCKEINIESKAEAYIHSIVLKKTGFEETSN